MTSIPSKFLHTFEGLVHLRDAGKALLNYRGQRRGLLRARRFDRMHGELRHVVTRLNSGSEIILRTDDRVVSRALYAWGEFERAVLADAIDLAGPDFSSPFIDVGANLGSASLESLSLGFERTIAFEPDPANYRCLSATIRMNALEERVATHQLAISNSSSMVSIASNPNNSGDSRIISRGTTLNCTEVEAKPLIEALDGTDDIGFLWVDVQGHEPEVLEGMQGLRRCPVVVEFTPSEWRGRIPDVVALLEDLGAQWLDLRTLSDAGITGQRRRRSTPEWHRAASLTTYVPESDHTDLLIVISSDHW